MKCSDMYKKYHKSDDVKLRHLMEEKNRLFCQKFDEATSKGNKEMYSSNG